MSQAILDELARHVGVDPATLTSKSRKRATIRVRKACMWTLWQHGDSYTDVGRLMGYHPSVVAYHCRTVDKAIRRVAAGTGTLDQQALCVYVALLQSWLAGR